MDRCPFAHWWKCVPHGEAVVYAIGHLPVYQNANFVHNLMLYICELYKVYILITFVIIINVIISYNLLIYSRFVTVLLNHRKRYYTEEFIVDQKLKGNILTGWPSEKKRRKRDDASDGESVKSKESSRKSLINNFFDVIVI
jgi:hypothetical protein